MKNIYVRLISLMMVAVMMTFICVSVNAEAYDVPDGYTVVDLCRDDPKSRAYELFIGPQNPVNEEVEEISISV